MSLGWEILGHTNPLYETLLISGDSFTHFCTVITNHTVLIKGDNTFVFGVGFHGSCVYFVCPFESVSLILLTMQVMECSWARLVKKVEVAEDLDQVIEAHDSFLEQITAQCLLDPHSQV